MVEVIIAPREVPTNRPSVYLAGAIDMGTASNWQGEIIRLLAESRNLVILNPRREHFEPEMEDEQIIWELNALEIAQWILMWFPKDSEAPISFLEMGLYIRSGKLILGVEEGFYRQRNIELTASRFGVPVMNSLVDLVFELRSRRP